MRLPLTTGVETPSPASGAFHATLSVPLQRTGSAASGATPFAPGRASAASPRPARQR